MKAIIVGAGLAGCAAAWALEKHGYDCVLIEASEKAGGRMRCTTIGEHNVDVGFHVLHTAYPSLHRWLDIEQLQLKPMDAATDLIAPSTGTIKTIGDRSAAATYARRGLRINAVAPGLTDTKMASKILASDAMRDAASQKIPTQRISQKEEAASAMHWLLTDAPDNLTGQVLHLDGGMANVLV